MEYTSPHICFFTMVTPRYIEKRKFL